MADGLSGKEVDFQAKLREERMDVYKKKEFSAFDYRSALPLFDRSEIQEHMTRLTRVNETLCIMLCIDGVSFHRFSLKHQRHLDSDLKQIRDLLFHNNGKGIKAALGAVARMVD